VKKHHSGQTSVHVKAFGTPVAIEREITVESQINRLENTIVWGVGDDLPLAILTAINQSPTTLSCLGIRENFIRGAGFTDEALMGIVIDKDGNTLWDLHCQLTQSLTLLESFATNFKYNGNGKIINTYVLGTESCRFVKPKDGEKKIETIIFNPYFGTKEYRTEYSKKFPVYNINTVTKEMRGWEDGATNYPGQLYFCGSVRPPYKFYPVPKYWSGKEWIYVDGQIQTFHKSNLDNGFFQSVLLNVIGNPSAWSNDPSQMKDETQTDGTVKKVPTKTNAQMFDDMMGATFSGVKKSGSALTIWSQNEASAIKVTAFPTTSNFDVLSGTFTDCIRGITISTETPAILANLPQAVNSLGSDGNSMLRAVEIMQSRTESPRILLENFYNKILLPNLEKPIKQQVKIKTYTPITQPVTVDKQFWDEMTSTERRKLMAKAGIELDEVTAPAIGEDGQPVQPTQGNEALKKLNMQQVARATKITRDFVLGKLTYDQAKQILMGYGFTESELPAWLPQQNGVEV